MDKLIKVYGTKAVSQMLNISQLTVIRRINDGSLKATKQNNKWVITESDLREYINTSKSAQRCTYNLLPSRIEDIDDLQLMRPSEVAERMRVSEQAVRIWIKQGRLKAIKPGGRVLIPREFFIDFINREYSIPGFGWYQLIKDGNDDSLPAEEDEPPKIK